MILVLLSTALLSSCMSAPRSIEEAGEPKLGMSKAEVDQYFASRNNSTGEWRSAIRGKSMSVNGEATDYDYSWDPLYLELGAFSRNILTWQMEFTNDKLTSYTLLDESRSQRRNPAPPPTQTQKPMNDMCKYAIANRDSGGIHTFC